MDLLDRLERRAGASRAELAGLAVLLAGGVVVLVVLLAWRPMPPGPGLPAAGAGTGAGALVEADVVVHVSGAVAAPGVVTLPGGARVHDAIDAAGGVLADADLSALNLARFVTDGEQVHVPTAGEAAASTGAVRPDGRLDLNRADAAALEGLPGIGPTLAQRIVAWRDAHGPFTSPGQLREVAGIGEKVFQGLADLVAV